MISGDMKGDQNEMKFGRRECISERWHSLIWWRFDGDDSLIGWPERRRTQGSSSTRSSGYSEKAKEFFIHDFRPHADRRTNAAVQRCTKSPANCSTKRVLQATDKAADELKCRPKSARECDRRTNQTRRPMNRRSERHVSRQDASVGQIGGSNMLKYC